jgi:hypothetical protein
MKTKIVTTILLLMLAVMSSCGSAYDSDGEYLYDKVGTDPQFQRRRPDPRVNKAPVPDYYYRYGPRVSASDDYQPQPQYAPQPQYVPQPQYAPYPVQPYSNYQAPGSRFYANPYEVPPSPQYNQPYDSDQYYVPPSNYYNQGEQGPQANRSKGGAANY